MTELRKSATDRKLVSIILPVYNGSRYLRQSIESCLTQTYANIELIVVDDASQDDSAEIVAAHADPRITLLRHHTNRKLPAALNTGFRASSGGYLTWTSHDNYFVPTAIAELVDFLEGSQGVDFVYSDQYIVDERDDTVRLDRTGPVERLIEESCLGGCFLYTRAVYEKLGAYDEGLFLAEDYDYWLRALAAFKLAHLGKPLYYYRLHPDSLSVRRGLEGVEKALAIRRRLFARHLWRYRRPLRRAHISAALLFLHGGRQSAAARAALWGVLFGAGLTLPYALQVAIIEHCLGRRGFNFLRRIKQKTHARFSHRARLREGDAAHGTMGAMAEPARRIGPASLHRQPRKISRRCGLDTFHRLDPIRRDFGYGYGQCVDRYYIEQFLAKHCADVHGRVLEVAEDTYTRQFGGTRVTQSDVLHIAPDHPRATIVADLSAADAPLPPDAFDCIILTQTLQFIYDFRAASRTLHRILKPGGVVLATFPGISQISRYDMEHWGDYWRFTSLSASRVFGEVFRPEAVDVRAYGNVLTAVAFMHGVVSEELELHELDHGDRDFELIVAVRAVK
jgi:glycosyltransferase involved in cell wall biosynthesis/SAM-dependent methyltransferase